MRISLSSILLLASLPGFAFGGSARPVCRDLTLPRLEVLGLDRLSSALSEKLGYQRGLLALFEDDVIVLLPQQPIARGKEAASAAFAAFDPDGVQRSSWTPTRIDASIDGTMGTSWGTMDIAAPAADGTVTTTHGKNIMVWHRVNGRWRISAYIQIRSSVVSVPPAGFGLFPDDTFRCSTPVDVAAETEVLKATDDAFAARSVDENPAIAFRDFAAPDGALRSGAEVIVGPDAIYAATAPFVDPFEILDWSASDGSVARSGDLGWTIGLTVDDVRDPGTDEDVSFTKYLTVWQKQPDGAWRYVIDGANIAPPPTN